MEYQWIIDIMSHRYTGGTVIALIILLAAVAFMAFYYAVSRLERERNIVLPSFTHDAERVDVARGNEQQVQRLLRQLLRSCDRVLPPFFKKSDLFSAKPRESSLGAEVYEKIKDMHLDDDEQRELYRKFSAHEGPLSATEHRFYIILRAVSPDNDIRKVPAFADLREVTLQEEYGHWDAMLFNTLTPVLLVLGIFGTLSGVHRALGENLTKSLIPISEALLPGILAVGCTCILLVLRAWYHYLLNHLMKALDEATLLCFLPALQVPATASFTKLASLKSSLGQLLTFEKRFSFAERFEEILQELRKQPQGLIGSIPRHLSELGRLLGQLQQRRLYLEGIEATIAGLAGRVGDYCRWRREPLDKAYAQMARIPGVADAASTAPGLREAYDTLCGCYQRQRADFDLCRSLLGELREMDARNSDVRSLCDTLEAGLQEQLQWEQELSALAGEAGGWAGQVDALQDGLAGSRLRHVLPQQFAQELGNFRQTHLPSQASAQAALEDVRSLYSVNTGSLEEELDVLPPAPGWLERQWRRVKRCYRRLEDLYQGLCRRLGPGRRAQLLLLFSLLGLIALAIYLYS